MIRPFKKYFLTHISSILKREVSLQRFLHKLKYFFNKNEHNKLYRSGSATARICDTPKMHKISSSDTFPELHSNFSSVGTFNYDLARFLFDSPAPVVPKNYSCKDTLSFISQIKNGNVSGKFLGSYNVTVLLTNILL